jgi:putative FmdB family regulatory protein
MPIYDYSCRACSHTFEALVLGGKSPKACPECQSEELERLMSLPAVRSESTKEKMLRGARARDKAQAKDMAHEQRKYELSHDD